MSGLSKNLKVSNPKSTVMPKKPFQDLLRRIRNSGYTVTKLDSGYEVNIKGQCLLRAMNGHNGYLVRYNTEFLS